MPIDWQQILFDPKTDLIGRLDRLSKKRFWDENLADEAFNWVLDKLKADNWSRLNAFNGTAKPSTYLHTVFLHALENFSREKFGYPRPKTWIKNQGHFWVQIWKRLCLEREPPEQINADLAYQNEIREAEIKNIIKIIKAKEPNCARQELLTSIGGLDENKHVDEKKDDGDVLGYQQNRRSTDEEIQADNYEQLLEVICQLTAVNCRNDKATKANNSQLLKKMHPLSQALQMQAHEQLILQMKFQQCMSDSAIARALDLSNYQLKTNYNSIISRLNSLFKEADIELQ